MCRHGVQVILKGCDILHFILQSNDTMYFKTEIVIFSPGNNSIVMSLTLYSIITPLKYVFEL